jgi:hypothetical protein
MPRRFSGQAETRRAETPSGDAPRTFARKIPVDLHTAFDEPPSFATVSSRRRVRLLAL